ncbi:MAG: flagellar motor protein MotB [Pseudomonadota bacterium]
MSSADQVIIIRRQGDEEEKKKGGVWKIAHADFMTAMMAFFLIMWLVNATDEEIKKSIANYFNPINLMAAPTDARGLSEPRDDVQPPSAGDEGGRPIGDRPMGSDQPGDQGSASGGGNVEEGNEKTMASAGILQETDSAQFNDPYARLASAASDISPEQPTSIDQPNSTLGAEGITAPTEETRDPFDPVYWQTAPSRPAQTLRPGRGAQDDLPPNSRVDATEARPRGADGNALELNAADPASEADAGTNEPSNLAESTQTLGAGEPIPEAIRNAAGPRSALAEQILLENARAQKQVHESTAETRPISAAQQAQNELAEALQDASAAVELIAGEKAVSISLTDDNVFSMFDIGSANPTGAALELLSRVGAILAEKDGRIIIRGHTDARPFLRGTSDNWTLSFQRAHTTKNVLVEYGVLERRFLRVEGLADREPNNPNNPLADDNRRIEILYQPAETTGLATSGGISESRGLENEDDDVAPNTPTDQR